MNRLSTRFACSLTLGAAIALCGCSTVPQQQSADVLLRGNTLDDAEKLLISAKGFRDNKDAAAVYRMRAAEIACADLARHSSSIKSITALPSDEQRAVHLLNEATAGVAPLLVAGGSSPDAQTYSFAGYSYRLTPAPADSRGEHKPSDFESVTPADKVPRKLCREWHTEDGIGAPLAPEWRMPTDEPHKRFTPLRGYSEPITAVLQLGPAAKAKTGQIVRVAYLDPSDVSHARVAQTEYPLAADFTAPIVERYSGVRESSIALGGLLGNPDVRDARLGMTEPYDPHRIPVLFVHGLNSHPLMWRDVINDLRFDPELRGKYQFWVFYYPTGWPPAYSAMRLREELAAVDKVYGRQHGMVLVGHSMGGIISRLQVISPGRAIWNAQAGAKADELYKTLPPTHLLKRALLFSANPDIGREIYICVPHRGSKMADMSIVGWFTKFIRMPANMMSAVAQAPGVITERRQLSSVNRLSPNNPLYPAIDHIPIQVPYHSIIGDRGRGDTPNSSDGVVQYWSSHLDGARSELIVPGPHGSYSLPPTIAELKRILKLHLASGARAESGSGSTLLADQ
jgi:pimeloyl-ACP methyl ester carboxylesterase